MSDLKTLREICDELGVTRRAVQGYEAANLVSPVRKNKYGYLLYGKAEQNRIKEIKRYQQFGFQIQEIKNLIDAPDCAVREALERQVVKRNEEQKRLNATIEDMNALIAKLSESREGA